MATTTRRRKAAPADALAANTLFDDAATAPDAPAVAPAEALAADAGTEPEADPPTAAKRARAPRKTAATPRKRAANKADAAFDGAVEAVTEPAEPPAVTPAPAPAVRPRRRGGRPAVEIDAAAPAELALLQEAVAEPPASEHIAPLDDDRAHPAEAIEPDDTIAAPAPTPEPAPPIPETSSLVLEDGLHRRLRWQAGSRCPDTLAQAARRWQVADNGLSLTHLDDLAELLAIAARTGHPVEVGDAVWTHLARLGDLQGRIAHLESRHPQGLDPAAQAEGSLLAGWRPCQLEAAFFAACVGRCVLADEPALQPEDELLLAARLAMQHFGAAAPVVHAPADAHAGWQDAWARVSQAAQADESPTLTLVTLDQPVPAGTELLLLDQRTDPQPAMAESPAAQAAAWLWVLAPADLLDRAEALPLLAAVDQLRQGGLATWQRDGDTASLAPLLLARRFADVAAQWPAWQPSERITPALAEDAATHAELAQRLARWQRTGFLADSDQLALRRALQAAWGQARAANAAALPGLLQEALASGAGRIVVFSEDPATLSALADTLRAHGLPAEALPTAAAPRQADQALRAFREATEPRILLVADEPQATEPRIGVQLASPLVIHLDTPWSAGALDRRLHRVRPGATQRQVPVWQLLPQGCLMACRAKALPALAASDTRLEGALLRGPALQAWQAELAALH